ncbi:HET-domain-containing protein, partial [Glonium stellatum]
MSLFTYEPLNVRSTDIRLVEILATENWSDPLELKLIHTSLTRPPEYLTLSYTWGAPFNGLCPEWNEENATIPIKLNNGVFYARWNLESALRHLRSYNWDTKLIWIDAIRIDQENSDEKAHQIILMKDIYAKSRMTVIWLGPATADS